MNISYERGGAIVEMPDVSFTYQVAETPRDFDRRSNNLDTLNWNNIQNYLGDFIVYPYGSNNDLPQIISDVVHNSYNVPGFLSRKTELLWGAGPKLFKEELRPQNEIRRPMTAQEYKRKVLENFIQNNLLVNQTICIFII